MSTQRRLMLRPSEWIVVAFFAYIALISLFFDKRPHLHLAPFEFLMIAICVLELVSLCERGRWTFFISIWRDWLPILYTLIAFREMELFLPTSFNGHFEAGWIKLDRTLLDSWHLREAIESLGAIIPFYLEFCYLWVYGVAAICLWVIYMHRKRRASDQFWVVYLSGTLFAYGLFPYFPSQPPRILFPGLDNPGILTWVRQFNLWILNEGTIHIGVFPSAHVSSAFACAWAMFLLFPERKRIGWLTLLYSVSVSIATIYGRYHYAADVIAGFAVSLVSAALAIWLSKNKEAVRFRSPRPSPIGSKL